MTTPLRKPRTIEVYCWSDIFYEDGAQASSASSINYTHLTFHLVPGTMSTSLPSLGDILQNEYTLDDNLPDLKTIRNFRPLGPSKADLGALEKLPIEVIQLMLTQHADLKTVDNFRKVNRYAHNVVHRIPQLDDILKHAPKVLQGIFTVQLGDSMTCQAVHNQLCTASCANCGDFAGYLYLLTCTRVCYRCFTTSKAYLPIARRDAVIKFGLRKEDIKLFLPKMIAIPGIYTPSMHEVRRKNCLALFDTHAARAVALSFHGNTPSMHDAVDRKSDGLWKKYAQHVKWAVRRHREPTMKRPATATIIDTKARSPLRFVGVVRMPWLDRESGHADPGRCCLGCQKNAVRPNHPRRRFTAAGFVQHVREYGMVRGTGHVGV